MQVLNIRKILQKFKKKIDEILGNFIENIWENIKKFLRKYRIFLIIGNFGLNFYEIF